MVNMLDECKKGLNISLASTAFDNSLTQKMLAVKSFLIGAGVSESIIEDDLAVGTIVLGVGDLWNLSSGEVKFSPAFYTMAIQLAKKVV
jgi:hypothetical protein